MSELWDALQGALRDPGRPKGVHCENGCIRQRSSIRRIIHSEFHGTLCRKQCKRNGGNGAVNLAQRRLERPRLDRVKTTAKRSDVK